MDAHRETHAADHAVPARTGPEAIVPRPETAAAAAALPRLLAGPPSPPRVRAETAIGLQRMVGNRTVRRLLAPEPAPAGSAPALAKAFDTNEDELLLAKTIQPLPDAAPAVVSPPNHHAATGVETTEPVRASFDRIGSAEVTGESDGLLAKAGTEARGGAPASKPMGPKTGGYTYPERVDAEIGAWFEYTNKTWRPIVKKLTGHYSLQARLIPGQAEITGPGGNTTKDTYCSQCENLQKFGSTLTTSWYVLAAIFAHEHVHATRFKPALDDAEAAISGAIEAVTIPDEKDMTESQAVAKLKADPAYQAAIAKAQALWLAAIKIRVAADHAAGGATEAAERTITEPLRQTICEHAAKQDWDPCDFCPPRPKKSFLDYFF